MNVHSKLLLQLENHAEEPQALSESLSSLTEQLCQEWRDRTPEQIARRAYRRLLVKRTDIQADYDDERDNDWTR